MAQHNITRTEAQDRASHIRMRSSEVTLVLTGTGETFRSITTLRFDAEAGRGCFVDAIARSIDRLVLNGEELDPAAHVSAGRITLDALAESNELVVDGRFEYMNTGEGLHRFVDPVDDEIYLYSQFEVPDARRVFAVFEQPDLKTPFTFTVLAPSHWTVVSNSPTPSPVEAAASEIAAELGEEAEGLSVWQFAPTPAISSYITAIVAGPYHSEHSSLTSSDGEEVPLGVFCRKSLAEHLDAENIVAIARAGFAFFEEHFDTPYPFEKYDQLFVPEFNAGAMENAGAVTFLEDYVFRSRPTEAVVERRAVTVLHELAHMWFGDLVTMRWWNDLWLNESFAEFMSTLATAEATEFSDAWTTFATMEKTWAYRQDQLPSTHPIVAEIADLEDVEVNFDGITYAKGASVLKALVAYVGREEFFAGLRAYFARHAWSNTELDDLLVELEAASGRDLRAWSELWLEESGVNVLRTELTTDDSGELTGLAVLQEPHIIDGQPVPSLRPHRVGVGSYVRTESGAFERIAFEAIDIDGERADVPLPPQRPDVVVLNDGDLTYAKVRLDEASLTAACDGLGGFSDSLTQLVVLSSIWDMVRDGELPAPRYVDLLAEHLPAITHSTGLLVQLRQLDTALDLYTPREQRAALRRRIADVLAGLLTTLPAGSDQQHQVFLSLCAHARADEHLDLLARVLDGDVSEAPGLVVDADLSWTIIIALAAEGRFDEAEIRRRLAADDTAAGRRRAETALAARPDAESKTAAFTRLVEDRTMPNAVIDAVAAGFADGLIPDEGEPITAVSPVDDFADEYFSRVAGWWETRTLEIAQTLTLRLFPQDPAQAVPQAQAWLESRPQAPKGLRRLMRENLDNAERSLRAQEAARADS